MDLIAVISSSFFLTIFLLLSLDEVVLFFRYVIAVGAI